MHFKKKIFFLDSGLKWKKDLKIFQKHTVIMKKYLSFGRNASFGDFGMF